MNNLRQLIRHYTGSGNAPDRQNRARRTGAARRRLTTESLERRELLAAGIVHQNSWSQYDVNNDYTISARDALSVINFLGRGGETEQGSGAVNNMFYDVNGDGVVTAVDALGVINAIGRGEGAEADPNIELILTARQTGVDAGDFIPDNFNLDLIPDDNGEINVEVGQVFDIEASFDDLRSGTNQRLGVFQLIANIDQQLAGCICHW